MKKVIEWIKKYWWLLLIVPALFVAVTYLVRIFIIIFSEKIGIPDLSGLEREFNEQDKKLDELERDTEMKIIKERDELWKRIDSGNPTPADIFNEEIK
ncbi:MAG TPA: hypothetical protein ENF81_01555 [Thermotogaceae bacterium]|nr:hypothetical protein [Thermotogaceae bacterium]